MSMLGQLKTCLDLMTTRHNSFLLTQKELSISLAYILQSILVMLIFFRQSEKKLCRHHPKNERVSTISGTYYFELCHLASICRFLISTSTATLVSDFVLSRIDYCNSLLFGSTHDVTSHLQQIQNYAARVILRLPKSSRITTHLK